MKKKTLALVMTAKTGIYSTDWLRIDRSAPVRKEETTTAAEKKETEAVTEAAQRVRSRRRDRK